MLRHRLLHPDSSTDPSDGLLFLPGYGQNTDDVEPHIRAICRDMLRVIVEPPVPIKGTNKFRWAAFDHKIRPLVFAPEEIFRGIELVMELSQALMEERGIQRLYLAGFSQGAVVAAHTVEHHPQFFAGAVLSHPILLPALLNKETTNLPPLFVILSLTHLDNYVTATDRLKVLEWIDSKGSGGSGCKKVHGAHAFTPEVAAEVELAIKSWQDK